MFEPKPFVFLGYGPQYVAPEPPVVVYSNWQEIR